MSRMVKIAFIVLAIIILVIFGINLFVVLSTRKYIVSEENAKHSAIETASLCKPMF